MKRSTGGLVLLERTSVKDGSLFLRLLTQSSICRFSSSILSRLLDVSNGPGSSSLWMPNKSVGCQPSYSSTLRKTHLVSTTMIFTFTKALSPALREIRILCSQSGIRSAGTRSSLLFQKKSLRLVDFCSTRQFIASKYPIIKKYNPDLPVLIREATGTTARVYARFGACTLLSPATRLTF